MEKPLCLLLAGSLLLSACSGNADQADIETLKTQVQTLQAQNTALTTERDALKVQLATIATNLQASQVLAERAAVQQYARSCALALETIKLDQSDLALPEVVNAKSCEDSALGEQALTQSAYIAASTILKDAATDEGYRILLSGRDGKKYEWSGSRLN